MADSVTVTPSASNFSLTKDANFGGTTTIVVINKFVADGEQPVPVDPTTSFTTLSGDYSSAVTVQGTGSNKSSNTEALQYLVDNTKGNLYKFTDHGGTVYWFTCTNAVAMTGDTVTVADCDYVVGDGTTVYSGGTLMFYTSITTLFTDITSLGFDSAKQQGSNVAKRTESLEESLEYLMSLGWEYMYKITTSVTLYFLSHEPIESAFQGPRTTYSVQNNRPTEVRYDTCYFTT